MAEPDRSAGSERPRVSIQRPSRSRPSAQPARWAVGATALAAVTVIGAGLVRFPMAADEPPTAGPSSGATTAGRDSSATQERPVKYVRLEPGQRAPKGARVIREAAPTPRVVIPRVAPPPQQTSVRTVTRTRQSG
jgi:hypothetical protein